MLTNPIYDPYQILSKVYSDGAHVKQAIADTYIEEINRARTVKIVYGVLEKDEYLNFCIRHYAPKAPKLAVRILLKISLYMLFFMDKKRYAVTSLAVELCKKLGKSGVSGFVNAFLRRANQVDVDAAIPKCDEGEAIALSYPLPFYKTLKSEYGDRAKTIAAATSKGLSVRFERGEENYANKERIPTPFEHVFIYPNFVRDDGFFRGDYTFQSVGSIAICDVVAPYENMLDACAAPGGKSVLLAKKCGKVTAFELHEHRVELIKAYKQRMGASNVFERQKDSSVFDEEYAESFDGVLCDVPCSGFGTVTENPDIKLFKRLEDFPSLNKAQAQILSACSKYVKVGGALYYSTCSLFERENDKIVGAFLKENTNFELEEISSPLPFLRKQYGLQFLPDEAFGAGFYVAKLKRKS